MKLTSNNVTLIANPDMKLATLGQNGKTPAFIEFQYLEEMRDLLNDFFEMHYKGFKETDDATVSAIIEQIEK